MGESSTGKGAASAVIVAEAYHRISNHLSALKSLVQIRAAALRRGPALLASTDVYRDFEDIAVRIDAVASLHRLLAQSPDGDIEFQAYLGPICAAFCEAAGFGGALDRDLAADCAVSASEALPMAMIVCELLTNAVKHGGADALDRRIRVSCRRTAGGGIAFEIRDNGPGLPAGFDSNAHGGTGMRIVHALAHQLHAGVERHSTPAGTTVRVTLPER